MSGPNTQHTVGVYYDGPGCSKIKYTIIIRKLMILSPVARYHYFLTTEKYVNKIHHIYYTYIEVLIFNTCLAVQDPSTAPRPAQAY